MLPLRRNRISIDTQYLKALKDVFPVTLTQSIHTESFSVAVSWPVVVLDSAYPSLVGPDVLTPEHGTMVPSNLRTILEQ